LRAIMDLTESPRPLIGTPRDGFRNKPLRQGEEITFTN
jgi:hypothetical protein